MDIEAYSQSSPHFYGVAIPALLKKHLDASTFRSVLDCGCGDGSLMYALKQGGYLAKRETYAVDLSQNRIELVRQIDPSIRAYVDSAEVLGRIPDSSIDFFISTQVIEHIDDKKFAAVIRRVVRTNGTIYLNTVFKKWYGWYFYRNNGQWMLDPTHLREYRTDNELLALFDPQDFTCIETRKSLIWFPVMDFLVKLSGTKNRQIYENRLIALLRKIKVPVPGYYLWEIVLRRV